MHKAVEECTSTSLLPALTNIACETFAFCAPPSTSVPSVSSTVSASNIQLHPRYIKAIADVTWDPDALHRTVDQMRMMQFIIKMRQHGLIVMPTGGGKTFCIALTSRLECSGITVVIVMHVALIHNMKWRTVSYRVPFALGREVFDCKHSLSCESSLLRSSEHQRWISFCG